MGTRGEAALVSIYGGESPSAPTRRPAHRSLCSASPRWAKPNGSPLPPLGLAASRLALCARVLPEVNLAILSTFRCGQH
jgi:hypothetical protein